MDATYTAIVPLIIDQHHFSEALARLQPSEIVALAVAAAPVPFTTPSQTVTAGSCRMQPRNVLDVRSSSIHSETGGSVWSRVVAHDSHVAHALPLLGNTIEDEALAFNTTIIGVLASLPIAQFLAHRPRFKTRHQIRNYISAALFAHLLAGLAVAATTLSVIGAIGNSADLRWLWVIIASTLVAVGVAQ